MSKLWNKIPCPRSELQLNGTLNGGQSFRWTKLVQSEGESWIGVFKGRIWFLKQTDKDISYKVYTNDANRRFSKTEIKENNELLRDYFRLGTDISCYYKEWCDKDKYFKEASEKFYGIRMLDQEPVENLFSFICSQNNHVSRISSMVENLCAIFGEKIQTIENKTYYAFPTVESLAEDGVEEKLRKAGFGYRARYIAESAKKVIEFGGDKWFERLKQMEYPVAKKELCKLTGIGAKVADCICLMSLGHLQAIPVDTHVFQIAVSFYLPHLAKYKTVTNKVYDEISDFFQAQFGPLAGWAQTVLFCADLKKFKTNCESTETVNESRKKRKKS